jgi:hypothetical protein
MGLVGTLPQQLEEDGQRDAEGRQQHAGADDRDRGPGGGASQGQGAVDEEPGQGERHGEPDPLGSVHQPRSRLMF